MYRPLFYSNPKYCQQKIVSVRDAIEQLPAFNALFQIQNASNPACGISTEAQLRWTKWVREGAINCGGEESELDFFMNNFSGATKDVPTSDVYIRYKGDRDFNILAQTSASGAGPMQPVTFTMFRSLHSGDGKLSNVAVNGSIFIYEDNQWLRVTAVDKSVDYAHQVTAVPFSQYYTANIRGGRKMMFSRVRNVDGMSCAAPSSSWETPGFASKVSSMRFRADWEMEIDFDRPYQDYLRYALTYDLQGHATDGWEAQAKIRARQEFHFAKNLQFFMGQKIDNPLLVGTGLALRDNKYAGFDGYLNTLLYAGGFVQEINPSEGYDMNGDFKQLMIRQDAMKQSTEFMILAGTSWIMNMNDRSAKFLKDNAQITFDSYKREGMDEESVRRLAITTYKYMNFSFHIKRFQALSDERTIGNAQFPHMAFMMPMNGLKDEFGQPVSAIEFYKAGGKPQTGTYDEWMVDHRKNTAEKCEKFSGSITETVNMAVHCPQKHILLQPVMEA